MKEKGMKTNFKQDVSVVRLWVSDQNGWSETETCMQEVALIQIFDHGKLSLDMQSEGGDLRGEPSLRLLPILQPHLALWNLCGLFMLCIFFRIISNLIAISLLLPAAAAAP